jgi:hypothetical protein
MSEQNLLVSDGSAPTVSAPAPNNGGTKYSVCSYETWCIEACDIAYVHVCFNNYPKYS